MCDTAASQSLTEVTHCSSIWSFLETKQDPHDRWRIVRPILWKCLAHLLNVAISSQGAVPYAGPMSSTDRTGRQPSATPDDADHIGEPLNESPLNIGKGRRQSSLKFIEPINQNRPSVAFGGEGLGFPRTNSSGSASSPVTPYSISAPSTPASGSQSGFLNVTGERGDNDGEDTFDEESEDTHLWTPALEERLVYARSELKQAQRRWSAGQELWLEEVSLPHYRLSHASEDNLRVYFRAFIWTKSWPS